MALQDYLIKHKVWKAFSLWECKAAAYILPSKYGILIVQHVLFIATKLRYHDVVSEVQNHGTLSK